MNQDDKKLLEGRNAYRYPTAYLISAGQRGYLPTPATETQRGAMSQVAWIDHHQNLLMSDDADKIVLGLMSVCYWGFFAGANPERRPTEDRALMRSTWVRDGVDQVSIKKQMKDILKAFSEKDVEKAMMATKGLSQFGSTSFASKLLSVLAPEQCGVHDKVIHQVLIKNGFEWKPYAVSQRSITPRIAESYAKWCQKLQERAAQMNALGPNARWQEKGVGSPIAWQAIDVERAFFHSKDPWVLGAEKLS